MASSIQPFRQAISSGQPILVPVRLSMQGYVTDSDLQALETAVIAETVA